MALPRACLDQGELVAHFKWTKACACHLCVAHAELAYSQDNVSMCARVPVPKVNMSFPQRDCAGASMAARPSGNAGGTSDSHCLCQTRGCHVRYIANGHRHCCAECRRTMGARHSGRCREGQRSSRASTYGATAILGNRFFPCCTSGCARVTTGTFLYCCSRCADSAGALHSVRCQHRRGVDYPSAPNFAGDEGTAPTGGYSTAGNATNADADGGQLVALGMPAAWTTTWLSESVAAASSAAPSATSVAAHTALAPALNGAQVGGQGSGDDMDESEDTPNFGQSSSLQLSAQPRVAEPSTETVLDLDELD